MDVLTTGGASEHGGSVSNVPPTINSLSTDLNNTNDNTNGSQIMGTANNVSTTNQTTSASTLFSNVVKNTRHPKKDQAIVFPAIDGFQLRDYVLDVGHKIDPKHILYASRMSNNRICLYLSSKQIVNSFITTHGGATIKDTFVAARKLITPSKRIIISNVYPFLPDYVIEDGLKALNLKLVSPISELGAGVADEGFKHIKSFRRQVYIADNENDTVPGSMLVVYEGEEIRLFLSGDQPTCFKCKSLGHIAAKCPNNEINMTEITRGNNGKRPPPSSVTTSETDLKNPGSEMPNINMNNETTDGQQTTVSENIDKQPSKRIRVESMSSKNDTEIHNLITFNENNEEQESDHSDEDFMSLPNRKTSRSLMKSQSQPKPIISNSETYKEIETMWTNKKYVMDYITFTDFLKNVKCSDRPYEVAKEYTENILDLLTLIQDARRSFKSRALKERCKRLATSLRKHLQKENIDTNDILSPAESLRSSQNSLNRSLSMESVTNYVNDHQTDISNF